MSADIGPGDFVACEVRAGRSGRKPVGINVSGSWPVDGGVYRVRAVGSYLCSALKKHVAGLRLEGIVASYAGHPDCWFPADSFRPIYKPPPNAFDQYLKAPNKQKEDA